MSYKKKSIVVPVDFSGESKHAVETASKFTETPESIHLVHVLLPLDAVSPGVVWGDVTDKSRQEAIEEKFTQFLKDENLEGATTEIRFGSPGAEIAEYADEQNAELVVLSSHGYHGIKRMLLGSVAEVVIRHVHCSVLVLRRGDAE